MKAKLLVVEDSREQRQHLVRTMEARGFEVQAVDGGVEALKAIKLEPPDVVILDVYLEDMDGYAVCRWLRLTQSTRDIIVIMLTVKGEVKERVEGLHTGADDYLPKPYADDELEARIYAALRSRVARQELRKRNAELEALIVQTEHLAASDPLTGLPNRRRFADVLRREFAVSRRYGHPLSYAALDLDHFKAVNDSSGHAAGDEVLKRFAEILTTNIRTVDFCARSGGDEFSLLFPHTAPEGALVVLERIRDVVATKRAGWPGLATRVSVSAGIAGTDDPRIKAPDALVEAADQALYEAKFQGRDRICLAARKSGTATEK